MNSWWVEFGLWAAFWNGALSVLRLMHGQGLKYTLYNDLLKQLISVSKLESYMEV